jgi:predicted permease
MRRLSSLSFRIAALFQRSQINAELDDELRSHIQHRADDLERSGLTCAEAERRARIEFGGYVKYKEQSHEALGNNLIETFVQDVRFSLRVLRKSPGFTVAAVVTLALAIGANAVVFSMFNGLVLRPANVPQAESLYALQRGQNTYIVQSYPDYIDLRDRNRTFDGLAAYTLGQAGLDNGDTPSTPWFDEVSGNYFDVLRIQPYLGRFFHAADEHGPNSAPYIVLTYAYWQTQFQGDRGVLGRTVRLNKHPFTIIGVAPPEFRGTLMIFNPNFFVPIVNEEQLESSSYLNDRGTRGVFEILGHPKAGVTPAQAIADLNGIGAYLEKTYPKDDAQMTFSLVRSEMHGNFFAPAIKTFLAGLMLLSGLILLAACANLGSLFAARAADRGREIALRLALGSDRKRILRQLFTEALLISIVGGIVGLTGSVALLRGLSAWQPFPRYPMHAPVAPDGNVYIVALLLTLASGFLFGAVPVKQILHANPYEVIKSGAGGAAGVRFGRRITLRDLLLVVQIAICAVLVTSSMVAVRGLLHSLHSDFGFDPRNAMLANTDLAMAGYRGDQIPAMQKRMIEAMETIPGVSSVGLVGEYQPLTMGGRTENVFTDKTTDIRPAKAATTAFEYNISPGYLHAASTALLSGRSFTWQDDKNSPRVAIVNKEFAKEIFGSVPNAIGGHYKLKDGTRVEVVGVVEDGKYFNLAAPPEAAMFLPILQSPASESWLVVRSASSERDLAQVAAAIRSKLRDLDAGLPVYIQPWTKELDGALFASRVATVSLGVLGVMGAMLSVTGIFGMAAYSVSKRLKELGIRMALGAQRREVLLTALSRPLRLLAFGSAAGLLLGLAAAKVLAFIVYQATPRDPLVLCGVVLTMALLGLLASWIPAQRAMSINPLKLLREE